MHRAGEPPARQPHRTHPRSVMGRAGHAPRGLRHTATAMGCGLPSLMLLSFLAL
jgi:hypothetical protein